MTLKRLSSCDESQLEVLLYGAEDSGPFRAVARHVESCDACQRRLTELAGDEGLWSAARELLDAGETGVLPAPESATDSVYPDWMKPADLTGARLQGLGILGPPSHPEMLGRLGRYEIERVIGVGGMGIVLKGFDTELNRPVAVKVLAPHLAHSGAARQRFAREGRAAAAVVHEHVVAIHNVEAEGEVPFLVMQYVAGESLQARVQRQGSLSTPEVLRIGIQAAAGLAAAHEQGLVHRDIKPANLLLETGVDRALLTDFGLARAMDDASLTHTGIVAGTPHYMSPEQADGRLVDHRSDLFSLGSVLYFMVAGHPPFRAERPMAVLHRICRDRHRPLSEVQAHVPRELSAIIDRLLDKKPTRRPGSAAEVQQTLVNLLSDIQQGRLPRWRPWRNTRFRKQALAVLTITATVASLSLGLTLWFGRRDAESPTATFRPPAPAGDARSGDPFSAAAVSALLSIGPGAEVEFATEAGRLSAELDRLESSTPAKEAYLRYPVAPWPDELFSVQRGLSHLETMPYVDPVPQGETP